MCQTNLIKPVLFADDTDILQSGNEIEDIENTVNIEMSKLHKRPCING